MNQDYQSSDLQNLIQDLDVYVNQELIQYIYDVRTKIFEQTKDIGVYNRPVPLNQRQLTNILTPLQKFNDYLQQNPLLAQEVQKPNNSKIINRYFEKISSVVAGIDARQLPSFKRAVENEFNRYNKLVTDSNSYQPYKYPEPYTDEPSFEADMVSSLKGKAGLAASGLRQAINAATKGKMPQKHPGYDNDFIQP